MCAEARMSEIVEERVKNRIVGGLARQWARVDAFAALCSLSRGGDRGMFGGVDAGLMQSFKPRIL